MSTAKTLQAIILSTLLVLTMQTRASAAVVGVGQTLDVGNPAKTIFENIQTSFSRDIRETAVNHLTSAAIDWTWNVATGTEISEYMGCLPYVVGKLKPPEGANKGKLAELAAKITNPTEAGTCQSVINMVNDIPNVENPPKPSSGLIQNQIAQGKTGGSLLALGYTLENTVMNEPIPVNLAYFIQDYGSKIPVIGQTAFAATYQAPLLDEILSLWKITRNISYALMSVVLLVVGIMIIMRKQLDQKVIVTIQYALPKIVAVFILITFSYPIGAIVAAISYSFTNWANILTIISEATGGDTLLTWAQSGIGMGGAGMALIALMLNLAGIGPAIAIITILLIIIIICLWIILQAKLFFIYIKIVIEIITAPLQLAMSAIPGNDAQLSNWFKKLATYALSIILMKFAIIFILALGIQVMAGLHVSFSGGVYTAFGAALVFLVGYGFAIKIPDQLNEAFLGKNKKRR